MFDMYESHQRIREIKGTIMAWGGLILALLLMRVLYTVLSPAVVEVYRFMNTGWMAKVNFAIGAGTIALSLFYFRKYARFQYGVLEVAFGLFSAWLLVQLPRLDLIALMGVLYVTVRGFDNCEIGRNERKKSEEPAA